MECDLFLITFQVEIFSSYPFSVLKVDDLHKFVNICSVCTTWRCWKNLKEIFCTWFSSTKTTFVGHNYVLKEKDHLILCWNSWVYILNWRYIMQRHFRPKSQRRGPREFRGQTLFINKIKGFYWILVRLTVNSLICNPNNFRPLISC